MQVTIARHNVFLFLSKQYGYFLSFSSLKRIREYPNVTLNGTLVPQELHVSPIDPDLTFGTLLEIFVAAERCEAPVLGDDDLLATGEFVLGATQGFDGCSAVIVTSPHREQNLANIHTSNGSVGLAPRTTHPSLQSIGTGTGQHLVDADDVVRVGADPEMETFFAGDFDKIFVGADTGGLEGLRGQLLVLIGDHVDAEGEFIDVGTLAAQIENANFGIGDTTVEAGLGIWLVLAVTVASCWTTCHLVDDCTGDTALLANGIFV